VARNLGEARVSILPDGTRFKPETEASVKKAMAGMQAKVKLEADPKELDAQLAETKAKIAALSKSLGNLKISDPNAQAFMKGMVKQADELKNSFDKIGDSKGLSGATGQLDRMIAATDKVRTALGKTTFAEEQVGTAAKASADKMASAYVKAASDSSDAQEKAMQRIQKARDADMVTDQKRIDATKAMYSKMFDDLNKRDKIKVKLDGSVAEAEALTLREKLKAMLDDIKAKVRVDNSALSDSESIIRRFISRVGGNAGSGGNSAGGRFGNGFMGGLAKSALMQNPGITAAVIAGLAALPAAVGAVGVLGGLALGAGLVIGAEKLISTQVKNLTAQVKTQMTGIGKPATPSALASQQLAITSTQNTITQLENTKKLTAAQATQLTNAKARLAVEKQALATSQQQGKGTAAQQAALTQSQQQLAVYQKDLAAFSQLNNAVKNLKLAFLDFAIVASKPLIKPFTDAIDELSKQLRGPLGTEFTDLFKAVGPYAKVVLDSLLLMVKGVLPGMTDMLNKARGPLTAMFLTFGKIIGLKLGQWFRESIPYIKDSAIYFNKLINALGNVGTFLIKFGGEVAKAFAGDQFKGFGTLISRIANDILKLLIPAFEGWTAVMAPVAKYVLGLAADLADFLVKHPAVTKAIFAMIAAYMLFSKALRIVDISLAITDALEIGGIWGLVAVAVVAAAILIIKYWGPISGFFVMIWKHIWSGFVGPMINFFMNTIPHAFGVSLNWIEKNWGRVVRLIGGPLGEVATFVAHNSKQIYSAIVGTWGHIENVVTGIVKPIESVITGAWNMIYKITKVIWAGITLAIRLPSLIILGLIGELVIGVRNLFNKVWPWLYSFTKNIWGHIENAITGVVKPIVSVVTSAWKAVQHVTSDVWNWLWAATKNIWGHVENFITGITKPIVSVVTGAWKDIQHITGDVWNWLFSATKDIWNRVYNFIAAIVNSIMSVVKHAWSNIQNWTRDAFNYVYQHIVSPLSKAAAWIAGTFVKSVKNAFSGLVSAVQSIWNGLKAIVAKPINFVIQSIWNPFAGFVNKGLSIFGIKSKLPMGNAIKLARGGGVPGFAPGSDTVPAMLSPGEYVLNPTAARAIGHRKLDAINASARPGGGQHMVKNAIQHHAGGGIQNNSQILADAERYKGHKYRWGGPSNPTNGWDCSSFVGYVLGHDFGRLLPGGTKWNPSVHGPVASQYNNTPGFNLVSHHTSDIQPGDLLVENSGGHVGFGAGPDKMFSAFGTNFGTLLTSAANMTNIYRNQGALSSNGPLSIVGSILTAAAQAVLSGITSLATAGLSKVPGKGPFHDLPVAVLKKLIGGAEGKLNNNPANFTQVGGGSGIPGGNPPGGTTAGDYANAVEGYKYLKQNLFGGSAVAAAGAVASIDGESTWNPFSVGTGGRGLIGWTPPGSISDAAFKGGMRTQLPAIIDFVRANGDGGAVSDMTRAGSILSAANTWGKRVERYGINDVHAYGLNLASGIMKQYHATGGLIGGHVQNFATGGTVKATTKKPVPVQTAAQKAAAAAATKAAAAAAKKAAAADAKRVAKLELKPMATLKGMETAYTKRLAKDVKAGNYRDYFSTTLALDDVDKAITGWKSPLQREHDTDAQQYRKYAALAAKAKTSGSQKAFFTNAVKAAKYAAAIAKIDKQLAGAAGGSSASTFVPLNIPLNRDYMTGFGQFGGQFKQGGVLPEGIVGTGVKTGMSYLMGAGERITPPHANAANPGQDMAQTNQLLLSLLAEMKTANQISKATAQNTQAAAKGLGNVGRLVR